MDRSTTMYLPRIATLFALLSLFSGVQVFAQVPVASDGSPVESLGPTDDSFSDDAIASELAPLTAAELETLVGPIALYPDDLLAIVLPASTYPLQIVQAARFLEAYKLDSSLEPDESWDESVVALVNYPEVVQLLNDDIDWTWQLGEAVINQQEDIVGAVESFRDRAYVAGNLKSDDYQTVSRDDDIIEIVPIDDDIIYVPYYEPERVVVYQPRPVYHYYARPYPVYYYPYPSGHAFSSGFFWGVTTAFRIGWATDHLHVHHASYWGHPYYGHHYYGHYYRRPSITVYNTVYVNNARRHSTQRYRDGDYWRPHRRSGSRQSDYYAHTRHYRNDAQSVRNSSNRTTTTRSNRDYSTTTSRASVTRSERNSRQPTTATTRNDLGQRPSSTARPDSDRRQLVIAKRNDNRSTRPANVSSNERPSDTRNSRIHRPEREPQQISRNSDNQRHQPEQHAQRATAHNKSNRATQQRAPRQTHTEPSRSQNKGPSRSEREPSKRAEKPERKSKPERSERGSRRST